MPTRAQTFVSLSLLALPLPVPQARAEDGIWKVGGGYVIRFEKLDLARPSDRLTLLSQVEQTAEKLCRGERPATAREACKAETVRSMSKSGGASLQASIEIARFERDGVQQAQR